MGSTPTRGNTSKQKEKENDDHLLDGSVLVHDRTCGCDSSGRFERGGVMDDFFSIVKNAGYHQDASSFFANDPHFRELKNCTLGVWYFTKEEMEILDDAPEEVEVLSGKVFVDQTRVAIHLEGNFKKSEEVDALFESHPLFAGFVHYSDIGEGKDNWWIQLDGSFDFWKNRLRID